MGVYWVLGERRLLEYHSFFRLRFPFDLDDLFIIIIILILIPYDEPTIYQAV